MRTHPPHLDLLPGVVRLAGHPDEGADARGPVRRLPLTGGLRLRRLFRSAVPAPPRSR